MDESLEPQADSGSLRLRRRLKRLGSYARRGLPFASGVMAALVALLLYTTLLPAPAPLTIREVNETVAQTLASATPPRAFSAYVYQAIQPALVLIEAHRPPENGAEQNGLGSGVVINLNGDILTSLHVVEGASEIQITFADGSESRATITATQPENDIAVLSAEQMPAQLTPATLGNPNALVVGDEVYAVGNPFGLYSSMSEGIISGFGCSFQPEGSEQRLKDLIQIDAAVNPGNSGGPLLNRNGQVIGIVVGIINPTADEVFIGIGFAVPITIAGAAAGLPAQ